MSNSVFYDRASTSLIVLVVTFILMVVSKKILDMVFHGMKRRMSTEHMIAKTRTLRSVLKNVIDFVYILIAAMIILDRWGVNIVPILTGAGLVGLAVSFGSQTLVKDLISGFFIILEDQFNVGDQVRIGTYEGNVLDITLRLTILEDKKENIIYIPNSQITSVIRLKKH